jgi:hypothetical protein
MKANRTNRLSRSGLLKPQFTLLNKRRIGEIKELEKINR